MYNMRENDYVLTFSRPEFDSTRKRCVDNELFSLRIIGSGCFEFPKICTLTNVFDIVTKTLFSRIYITCIDLQLNDTLPT